MMQDMNFQFKKTAEMDMYEFIDLCSKLKEMGEKYSYRVFNPSDGVYFLSFDVPDVDVDSPFGPSYFCDKSTYEMFHDGLYENEKYRHDSSVKSWRFPIPKHFVRCERNEELCRKIQSLRA